MNKIISKYSALISSLFMISTVAGGMKSTMEQALGFVVDNHYKEVLPLDFMPPYNREARDCMEFSEWASEIYNPVYVKKFLAQRMSIDIILDPIKKADRRLGALIAVLRERFALQNLKNFGIGRIRKENLLILITSMPKDIMSTMRYLIDKDEENYLSIENSEKNYSIFTLSIEDLENEIQIAYEERNKILIDLIKKYVKPEAQERLGDQIACSSKQDEENLESFIKKYVKPETEKSILLPGDVLEGYIVENKEKAKSRKYLLEAFIEAKDAGTLGKFSDPFYHPNIFNYYFDNYNTKNEYIYFHQLLSSLRKSFYRINRLNEEDRAVLDNHLKSLNDHVESLKLKQSIEALCRGVNPRFNDKAKEAGASDLDALKEAEIARKAEEGKEEESDDDEPLPPLIPIS